MNRELLQQALDALESLHGVSTRLAAKPAHTQKAAQTEQVSVRPSSKHWSSTMSNAIPLPPLPETHMHDGVPTHWLSSGFLRARDKEIVRCVLQALANEFEDWDGTKLIVSKIRNMEFHHE